MNFEPIGRAAAIGAVMCAVLSVGCASRIPVVTVEPYAFETDEGEIVDAELGSINVALRRDGTNDETLVLSFVRFAATTPNPGSPIIYLAGGPGGSGIDTARGERFPLFMALRELGDVIALDQRGTGLSNSIPECVLDETLPLDRPVTQQSAVASLRRTAQYCTAFWNDAGIDIAAYNTRESAADLEDLRRALGVERITLWGISYGTHLALAAMDAYPQSIERAVLASAEGLNQTVKLPVYTDRYLERADRMIVAQLGESERLTERMRHVFARLSERPQSVEFEPLSGGDPITMVIGLYDLQLFTSAFISDPDNLISLHQLFSEMEAGDFHVTAQYLHRFFRSEPLQMSGMSEAMDLASGISDARLAVFNQQAERALLGDTLNFPMPHLAGMLDAPDLGDEFRTQRPSEIPVLFLTGDMDGRTYPEEHAEIIANFDAAQHVVIENAGHNLFMSTPEVTDVILEFLRTGAVSSNTLTVAPPVFE